MFAAAAAAGLIWTDGGDFGMELFMAVNGGMAGVDEAVAADGRTTEGDILPRMELRLFSEEEVLEGRARRPLTRPLP